MDKEHGGAAGALPRCFIDDVEALVFHAFEGLPGVAHAEGDVGKSAFAAVLIDGSSFRNRMQAS